ncbi:hypothetical protein H5410_033069, partial [Solanum commersonii]
MKIRAARLASEDRFWSGTTLCSLRETLDSSCGIWLKMILGVGPTFRRCELQMEISPSPLRKLQENFEGNLAVISETRGEASFEIFSQGSSWYNLFGLKGSRFSENCGEAFGDRSERKRSGTTLFRKVMGYGALDIIEYPYPTCEISDVAKRELFRRRLSDRLRRYSGLESMSRTSAYDL